MYSSFENAPCDVSSLESQFVSRRVLTLEPLRRFLADIGNPQQALPPIIHVAGTNGKGSSVAMLRAIYQAQGYGVHVMTSPHLHRVTERLILVGKEVSPQVLWDAFERHHGLAKVHNLSWYELMIAVSFELCVQTPGHVLLLEVGLGGEFDGTNVIEAPALSMITPISLDHEEFLGSDIENVARAKSGIMKAGCPCLSSLQEPAVERVLRQVARDVDAPFEVVSMSLDQVPRPNLEGGHQHENARLVVQAIEQLQPVLPVGANAILKGLQAVTWRGRLEKIGFYKGAQIWFDVAHNPASAQVVGDFCSKLVGRKILLFALGKSKDAKKTLTPLMTAFDEVIFFAPPDKERYHTPQDLAILANDLGAQPHLTQDFSSALSLAGSLRGSHILIAGSHYLAEVIENLLLLR